MKILVTGGLGYIGGRILKYLREKEPKCGLSVTTRDQSKRPAWADNRFEVLEMDVRNAGSIENCLARARPDVIVHLAATNEIDSENNPELAMDINVRGTFTLLKTADKLGINKIIYFSTFHVYGLTNGSIIDEETPTRPYHPYAITHRSAEDYVDYFRHYSHMKTLIFRLSNSYGYPMHKEVNRWTLVFNDLCRQAVTKGKIILNSSGKQYRDFISLNDVARAVHHFIFVNKNRWDDGLFNLGGNCPMSIMEVAEKISAIYERRYNKKISDIEIKDVSLTPGEIKIFRFSIEKLLRTGFNLEGDMDYEINQTMKICEQFKN